MNVSRHTVELALASAIERGRITHDGAQSIRDAFTAVSTRPTGDSYVEWLARQPALVVRHELTTISAARLALAQVDNFASIPALAGAAAAVNDRATQHDRILMAATLSRYGC